MVNVAAAPIVPVIVTAIANANCRIVSVALASNAIAANVTNLQKLLYCVATVVAEVTNSSRLL